MEYTALQNLDGLGKNSNKEAFGPTYFEIADNVILQHNVLEPRPGFSTIFNCNGDLSPGNVWGFGIYRSNNLPGGALVVIGEDGLTLVVDESFI